MRKEFFLKGLDCPHCSAKIEKDVSKLPGVTLSEINLMKQILTVEAEDIDFKTVEKIVHSYEPDVEVFENDLKPQEDKNDENKNEIIRFAVGIVLFILALVLSFVFKAQSHLPLLLYVISYLVLGFNVVMNALKNIVKGHVFDENFLMSLSTIGAFLIGEYPEAVAVMLFYQIGEFFQDLSVERSRKSISDLMNIRPDSANVIRHGTVVTVYPENVKIGETIVVKAGERIALDGIIEEGESIIVTTEDGKYYSRA